MEATPGYTVQVFKSIPKIKVALAFRVVPDRSVNSGSWCGGGGGVGWGGVVPAVAPG